MDQFKTLETSEEELKEVPELSGIATKVTKLGDKLRLEFNTRDALFFQLRLYTLMDITPQMREAVNKRLEILQSTLKGIELAREGARGFKVIYSLQEGLEEEEVLPKIAEAIDSPPVQTAIAQLLGIKPDSVKSTDKELNRVLETGTHLQPNGLLKTIAQHTGRDTRKPTLFNREAEELTDNNRRDVITRKSGELMMYLVKAYQDRLDQGEPWMRIDNLSKLARETGLSSAQEVKNLLEYLGGYVHPFLERKVGGGIKVEYRQLLEVNVHYSSRVESKYDTSAPEVRGALNFLKNEPVDFIECKPCSKILDQLSGKTGRKDLGSRVIYNRILGELPALSEGAYKLLTYALSNRGKTQAIGEEKLLPKIGYDEDIVYKEGGKRIRDRVLKSLQELQELGHLESYSFDQERRMYSLTISEKTAPRKRAKP
jgi:hypothetical protein